MSIPLDPMPCAWKNAGRKAPRAKAEFWHDSVYGFAVFDPRPEYEQARSMYDLPVDPEEPAMSDPNLAAIHAAAEKLAEAKADNAAAEARMKNADKEYRVAEAVFTASRKNVTARRKALAELESERHTLLRKDEVSGN